MTDTTTLSLKSIDSCLDNIQQEHKKEIKAFDFNSFKYELDKDQYETKYKIETVKRLNSWIEANPDHTYPKSIKTWINTINAQQNLRNIVITYNVSQLLNNVYLKSKCPQYLVNLYENFIGNNSDNRTFTKIIICNLSAFEIFDIIKSYNLISIKGKRVYINRFILYTTLLNKRTNIEMEVDNEEDVDRNEEDVKNEDDIDRNECIHWTYNNKKQRLLN